MIKFSRETFLPFLVMSWLIMVFSCSDDVTLPEEPKGKYEVQHITNDQYDVTYQYQDSVLLFNETTLNNYVYRIEDDSIVYISKNVPNDLLPHVGCIIAAPQTASTPYGLGNEVVSMTSTSEGFKCVTSPASLECTFKQLELSAQIALTDTVAQSFHDNDGDLIEVTQEDFVQEADNAALMSPRKVSIGSPKILTLTLDKKYPSGLFISGKLTAGATFVANVSLSKKQYEFSVEFNGGWDGTVGAKTSYQGSKEPHKIFGPKRIVTGVVTIGPVCLRPFVDLGMDWAPDIKGELSTGISKQYGIKAGFKRDATTNGFFHENTTKSNLNPIKNLTLKGKGEIEITGYLRCGAGIYTTSFALAIDPNLSLTFGPEASIDDVNLFHGTANVEANFNVDVDAGVDAEALIMIFGKELFRQQKSLASINLWHWSKSLIPVFDENSFDVIKRDTSPLTFDAKYNFSEPGLLAYFADLTPALRVYRGGQFIKQTSNGHSILYSGDNSYNWHLTGLEQDVSYTAKPILTIYGVTFEGDGIPFSSTTPTAAITDIVQTGSRYEEGACLCWNGEYYDYEFKFLVNAQIKGSENCESWGIYDPNSKDVYNPCTKADGRVTQYWTAWSNSSSATFNKTPYAVLLDGTTKMYETNSHTVSYGKLGTPRRNMKGGANNTIVMRLDSIVVR